MDARRRLVFGSFLLLAGAALWVFVVDPALGPSERAWDAQIESDAVPLTQALRYDFHVEEPGPLDRAWEKRRALYDEEHLGRLRDKLLSFVDFQVAEYADAKEVYVSASRPQDVSEAARAARQRLRDAFPSQAEEMISQFDARVREQAYRASPRVAGGVDLDRPRYDAIYDDVVGVWLPRARARVDELTRR